MGYNFTNEDLNLLKWIEQWDDSKISTSPASTFNKLVWGGEVQTPPSSDTNPIEWQQQNEDFMGPILWGGLKTIGNFINKNVIGAPIRAVGTIVADTYKNITWKKVDLNTPFGRIKSLDNASDDLALASDAVNTLLLAFGGRSGGKTGVMWTSIKVPSIKWLSSMVWQPLEKLWIKEGLKQWAARLWLDAATWAASWFAWSYAENRDISAATHSALIGWGIGGWLWLLGQSLSLSKWLVNRAKETSKISLNELKSKPFLDLYAKQWVSVTDKSIWGKIVNRNVEKRALENNAYNMIMNTADESGDIIGDNGQVLFKGKVDNVNKLNQINELWQQRYWNTVNNITDEVTKNGVTLDSTTLWLDSKATSDLRSFLKANRKTSADGKLLDTETEFLINIANKLDAGTATPTEVKDFMQAINTNYESLWNIKNAYDSLSDWFNDYMDKYMQNTYEWQPWSFSTARETQSAMIETRNIIDAMQGIKELQNQTKNLKNIDKATLKSMLANILEGVKSTTFGIQSNLRKTVSLWDSLLDKINLKKDNIDEQVSKIYGDLGNRPLVGQDLIDQIMRKSDANQSTTLRQRMINETSSKKPTLEPVTKATPEELAAERKYLAQRELTKAEREQQLIDSMQGKSQWETPMQTISENENNAYTLNAQYSKFTKSQLKNEKTRLQKKLIELRFNPWVNRIKIGNVNSQLNAVKSLLK